MGKLKEVIVNLIVRNMIVDKALDGKESSLVVDLSPEGEETVDNTKRVSEHEANFNALHEFIDETFYTTLVCKVSFE